MPIRYVNPARMILKPWDKLSPATKRRLGKAKATRMRAGALGALKRERRHVRESMRESFLAAPTTNPSRRKRKMARKLFGAAAKAHARKLARVKRSAGRRRRKRPAARVTHRRKRRRTTRAASTTRRRRRRNPWAHSFAGGRSVWTNVPAPAGRLARIKARHAAMAAGAAPRKRRKRRGSSRRRRVGGRPSTVRSMRRARRTLKNRYVTRSGRAYRRRYRMRSNPTRKRRRRNPRYTTAKSLRRARRTIRNRRATAGARAYRRRYRMRSNPVTAASVGGAFKQTLIAAAPIAISLYGARALSYAVAPRLPLFDRIPAKWQGTAMAVLLGGLGFVATRKISKLQKHAGGVMIGLGLNFLDNVLSALAPASIKARIGLGDYIETGDVYSDGLGARPLWDGQMDGYETVGDYVEVGNDGLQEELGVEEELGLEQELGSSAAYLGGVQQSSMLKQVPNRPMLAQVPDRSFTEQVPRAGAAYDSPANLYGGIFAGGFGG